MWYTWGMKTCFKCKASLPLSEFYVHKMMADGHLGKCKTCTKNDVHRHRRENLAKVRAYDIARSKTEKRKADALKNQTTARKRWPMKTRARLKLRRAVRSGKVKRQPCAVCGSTHKIHGHHEDYSKPLDVIWLCQTHHLERHGRIPDPA